MKSVRRPVVALSITVLLVLVQAIADPTGLLALVGWSGAIPSAAAGIWPFAPYLVFVPVLLAMVWWVTVRAGDRFWTLTAGVTLAVLLAQAAAAFVMSWDLATAGWAAGYVAAKAVPAALIIAAITRWFGGKTVRATYDAGSIWPAAVLFAALAPLLAGLWWTGAVYAPGIPTARPENGVLSVIVTMALLAGASALTLRWMRARVAGVMGGWLAALVAGGMVGVVQGVVGLFVDGGFRSDIWPLMATYIAVADGLAFGACVGWIVGIAAIVTDRVIARRSSSDRATRTPLIVAASIAVVALVVTVVVAVQPATTPAEASPAPGFLRAEGSIIADGNGNQVLLRGVNVNNLIDFYRPQADVPATRPLTEDDFATMASYGFDVVRLNISWSALEPERGTLDAAYLARIDDAVQWGKQHGIYTVLDMHQDGWWNGASPASISCRPGTDPMWG